MPTSTAALPPVDPASVPAFLREQDIWRNFRTAEPVLKAPCNAAGITMHGNTLSNAYSLAEAVAAASQPTRRGEWLGVGITIAVAAGFTGFDTDLKNYAPDAPHVEINGIRVPVPVAPTLERFISDGGYVHRSMSEKGFHGLIRGTPAVTAYNHKIAFPLQLALDAGMTEEEARASGILDCEIELYHHDRYFTFNGPSLNANPGALEFAETSGTRALLDDLTALMGSPAAVGASVSIEGLSATLGTLPGYTPVAQLTGALAQAARDDTFRRLWDGDLSVLQDLGAADLSPSQARWELIGRLVRLYRGDAQAVVDAFKCCALLRDKDLRMWQGAPKFVTEIKRRVAGYLHSRAEGSPTEVTAVDWPMEDRKRLLTAILTTAPGSITQRRGVADVQLALLAHLDRADGYHVHEGKAYIHCGGVKALADDLGKRSPDVARYLGWMAEGGTIATFIPADRSPDGKAKIALDARSSDCLALRGSLRGVSPIPARPAPKAPSAPRKPRRKAETPAAPRPARIRTFDRTRWTMWMIATGERDAQSIAALTGQTLRTVKTHVKTLEGEGIITADLTPLCALAEFEVRRREELLARQEKTRARAAADRERWEAGWNPPRPLPVREPNYLAALEPLTPDAIAAFDAWADRYITEVAA